MKRYFLISLFLIFTQAPVFSKCVLVVGGAGFIGSHVNEKLQQNGYETIVLDNLVTGNRKAVINGLFIQGDMGDAALLDHIFTTYHIDAVVHLAGFLLVGESMQNPLKYYINNTGSSLTLLNAMHKHKINIIIFSSSCTVFGSFSSASIDEEQECCPINPYGRTKHMMEMILNDLDQAYGLRYCCLRYFNTSGGDPTGKIKNDHAHSTMLIPSILRSLKYSDGIITVFGTDYPTPDGTCIRDYVHVEDIATAHLLCLEKLLNGSPSICYNLGNQKGFSVKEVISAVEKVTGRRVHVIAGDRRPGDAVIAVADSTKIRQELGWEPRYTSIETMIEHAWNAMN